MQSGDAYLQVPLLAQIVTAWLSTIDRKAGVFSDAFDLSDLQNRSGGHIGQVGCPLLSCSRTPNLA